MPTITHVKDPFNTQKNNSYHVPDGTNLLSWLKDKFDSYHDMSLGLSCSIIFNSKTILKTDDNPSDSQVDFEIHSCDSVIIVNRPAGVDPFSLALFTVAAVAGSALISALTPSLPGDVASPSTSPNNDLNAATNSFRPGQGIPEIFGTVIAYPDFIQPSYFEYIDNLKIVRELFCIGVGQYDVRDVKTGETLIEDITGSSFETYGAGVTPPSELLSVHRGTNEVDGQVLLSPDDPNFLIPDQIDEIFRPTSGPSTIILVSQSTLIADLELSVGDMISVSTTPPALVGTFEIQALEPNLANPRIMITTASGSSSNITSSTVAKVDSSGEVENWLGWFDIPGDEALEIWFHWQMPQGRKAMKVAETYR